MYIYFHDFYAQSITPDCDENGGKKESVDECIDKEFAKMTLDNTVHVSPEVVSESIRKLPKEKSCGPDKVVYEHLQIANDIVSIYLANLYTSML